MKGRLTIFLSLVLVGCVLSTSGQTRWTNTDSIGNLIIVNDVGQLKFPFDKAFIADNLVGSFFPHQIHDSGREFTFKILEVSQVDDNRFEVRATINRRELREGELHSSMVHKFQFDLETTSDKEFKIKSVKLLYIEI